MYCYPPSLEKAIESLTKLPGVGVRTAERMIFYLLKDGRKEIVPLAQAMANLKNKVSYCIVCGNLSEGKKCLICSNSKRDTTLICVVGEASDVVALEKTNEYRGLYHVLSGSLSPLDGVGPDKLRIKELLARVKGGRIKEIILATNPTAEGEATALFLTKKLKPYKVKITQIARGIPVGSSLEHVDHVTLAKSLEGRREI